MKFGPKRGSVLFIFNNLIKDFGLLIIALLIGFFSGDVVNTIIENAGIFAISLIAPIKRTFEYLSTYIAIDETKIVLKRGIFKKETTEIPIGSVTTIDLSQNVICQVLGRYKLKIDNAGNVSATSNKSQINMIFKGEDAFEIRRIINEFRGSLDGFNLEEAGDIYDEEERGNAVNEGSQPAEYRPSGEKYRHAYMVKTSEIFLYGLLKSKLSLILQALGLIAVAWGFIGKNAIEIAIEQASVINYTKAFVAVGIVLLLLIFLATGCIMNIIKYSNFTVKADSKAIYIEYGFFTRKSFTLQKNRISGFYYEQSWLMRKLKVGAISAFAIGFGTDAEDKGETSILHPYIKEEMVKKFLCGFMDDFNSTCQMYRPEKQAFRYFFIRPVFIFTVILIPALIVAAAVTSHWWISLVGVILCLLSAIGRVMEYFNTSAGGNSDHFVMSSGGYNKTTTYVKTNNVEAVTDVGGRFKRRKGIVTINVDFLGPITSTSQSVYNLGINCSKELSSLMRY